MGRLIPRWIFWRRTITTRPHRRSTPAKTSTLPAADPFDLADGAALRRFEVVEAPRSQRRKDTEPIRGRKAI